MTLASRLLTGAAALGLVISTLTSATPALIAQAAELPDVAVKYDGYNLGANGEIDVAFSITNNQFADVNLTLNGRCTYNYLKDNSYSRMVDHPDTLGMFKSQVNPVPKLVVCYPDADEYVVRVQMYADVAGGDADPTNNRAIFESDTNGNKPDVKVAFDTRIAYKNGSAKAQFNVTNPTKVSAPVVSLMTDCYYFKNTTKAFSHTTKQYDTVSVPSGANMPRVVSCAAIPGEFVEGMGLGASVVKPMIDLDPSNNAAYSDTFMP